MADEPLGSRFDTVNLTLALFLEAYASRTWLGIITKGKYQDIRPIPLVDEDIKGPVRERFDGEMAEIAIGSILPHKQWIMENVSIEHFLEFTALCKLTMERRFSRRLAEMRIIMGAQIIAFFMANLIRLVIVSVSLDLDAYWMLGMLALTMLLAGFVVLKGHLKLT